MELNPGRAGNCIHGQRCHDIDPIVATLLTLRGLVAVTIWLVAFKRAVGL